MIDEKLSREIPEMSVLGVLGHAGISSVPV
jgi:hypothetical protein